MPNPSTAFEELELIAEQIVSKTTAPYDFSPPPVIEGGGDTNREFFYLAGPMTDIPKFNFPEFHRVAERLREDGYNVVNPAELDDEIERAAAEQSPDGADDGKWADCLRRDIAIVSNPNCVGLILLDGWEHSSGAQFETYVAMKLGLVLWKLIEPAENDYALRAISRGEALDAVGIVDA